MSNSLKKLTPLKAIRLKCLDCSAGQPSEVRKCPMEDCPLFTYRFGHNPNRKGLGMGKSALEEKSQLELGKTEK